MIVDYIQLAWFFLFIFQVVIALYFLRLYWFDKDKGKLIFSIGFLCVSYSHFYEAITPSIFGQTPLNIFTAIQYWSFFPLIFALAIAIHQKNLEKMKNQSIFPFFSVLCLISFIFCVINPTITGYYFGYVALLIAAEITIVGLYNAVKNKGLSDILFLFSLISYFVSGIGLLGFFNIGISIFGFFNANGFLFLVFKHTKDEKKIDNSSISNYFSIKEQLAQTKTELSEKERTFQTLFNQLADPVMILDKKGTFLELTDRVKEYTGFEKEEILGKNFLTTKLLTAESKAICIKNLMKRMAGRDVKPYMVEALTRDGRKIPFEVNAQQIRYKGKKADLVIFRDISERIRAQQRIRESEERYRNIFDQASDGIFIHDFNGRFVDVNRQMTEIFGYSKKDFKSLTIRKIHVDEEKKGILRLDEVMQNGSARFESDFKKKNGQTFTGDVISSVISIGGRNFVQGTLRDITKRKDAERKLREAHQKLQEMNSTLEKKVEERTVRIQHLLKQKDDFINQLGHDLKNPLGPILNLSQLLEKKENDAEKKKIIKVISRNAGYMKNLVIKTLDLARINSPNMKVSMDWVKLKNLVDDVIKSNRFHFKQKDMTVSNVITPNIEVVADELLLEELLNNILNNAVKYSNEQGKIIINAVEKIDEIEVSIRDNGIGMTKDQLEKLFDEFYKADESRHDFDSSGLGLSIAKKIVEKHHGRIWAESDGLNEGSTFYFTLPLTNQQRRDDSECTDTDDSFPLIREKIDAIIFR